jgi:4-hydroxy-tetrahydrodipicolinate reductase
MTYRVVQWGSGNVGKHALRSIIQRPDMELVGLRVYNPEKVGMDAGEIVGFPPVGIVATDDPEAIMNLDADCVNYNPLGGTLGSSLDSQLGDPLDDISRLLEAGFNVTSSAIDLLVYPKGSSEEIQSRLEKACEAGQSTFFESGVNPGFTMDLWPITMSRLSRTIDRIEITETLDMVAYTSTSAMKFMGFGQDPDLPSPLDDMHGSKESSPFYTSILMTADALRFELEDFHYEREVGLATDTIEIPFGTIEAGTIAVVKMTVTGIGKGRPVLVNHWVWRCSDEVRPEWGLGESWAMTIEGDPEMSCTVEAKTKHDSKRIVSLTVATAVVNAIPSVCDAPWGVRSVLDLPTWGGGYVTD